VTSAIAIDHRCEPRGERTMKMFVGMALVAGLVAGCLDTEQTATPPVDQSGEAAAQVSTLPADQVESVAPESVGVSAHSNCGEMLYCRDPEFHGPEYKCLKGSGCTFQQIQNDMQSDCDYVCGASACQDGIEVRNCPF
jgi:hypothetical protein